MDPGKHTDDGSVVKPEKLRHWDRGVALRRFGLTILGVVDVLFLHLVTRKALTVLESWDGEEIEARAVSRRRFGRLGPCIRAPGGYGVRP